LTAKIIDGVAVARKIRSELAAQTTALTAQGMRPGLAVILVGDDPASSVYVRKKVNACAEVGIESQCHRFDSHVKQHAVLDLIDELNRDPGVHGILVQLPLPSHFNVRAVLEAISQNKDVDGFHLYNVGALVTGQTVFPPCTPYGVQHLLSHEQIPIEGQNVVVVGASNIVGKPMGLMLMQQNATICICHAKTRDLAQFTILADILIVAAGKPALIKAEMVKTGAAVIDVGINRLPDGRLVGDVDFDAVAKKASHITPVPGGVGPMTVTMLLHNTVQSAQRALAARMHGPSPTTHRSSDWAGR
jgi:methylenetetrahydrofolate dehydrogenase (NADP+)/methenyltetrahydrofolate cyclohydrolase